MPAPGKKTTVGQHFRQANHGEVVECQQGCAVFVLLEVKTD